MSRVHIVRQDPPWRRPGSRQRAWCGNKTADRVIYHAALMDVPPDRVTLVAGAELPDPLPYHWPEGDAPYALCAPCRTAEQHYRLGSATKPLLTALHFAENTKGGSALVERELAAMLALIRAHPDEYQDAVDGEAVLAALSQ